MVRCILRQSWTHAAAAAMCAAMAAPWASAAPSAADALKLTPVQEGVEFDQPIAGDVEKCTIKAEKVGGSTAWVVRGPDGSVLRQFSDANGDNVVDTWSYFFGGLETYRDIDGNFNGKADTFRWFHTAGTRIGKDRNEDGSIDLWERISPEEAAAEAVAALTEGNGARFQALLPSASDLKALGQSAEVEKLLAERVLKAREAFAEAVKGKQVRSDAEFTDFGGLRPGTIPEGTRGSTKELTVYENVWAMMLNGEQHEQLQLGTIVQVGEAWKLIDGPSIGSGTQMAGGFFFQGQAGSGEAPGAIAAGAPSDEMQKILAEMEKLDTQMATASSAQLAKLSAARADLLQKLAEISPTRGEQEQWLRQMADMVSAAVQGGQYPQGVERLTRMEAALAKGKASDLLLTHFEFRRMQAEQGLKFSDPKANHAKVQEEWLAQLEKFVKAHGQSEHAAEALLQLAMYSEFGGEEGQAATWYQQLAKQFPTTPNGQKARGALTRLNCVGKPLAVAGKTVDGKAINTQQLRGRPTLLHYWSTAGMTVKADHAVIKDVLAKYGDKSLAVVGINLDYSREELVEYLRAQRLTWPQIFEEGGFESRLANEMGIITLPLFVLVDAKGEVVSNSLQAAELEDALKELSDDRAAGRPNERRR